MEENGALSSSMLVPFRPLTPANIGGDYSGHRQLAVVPTTTSAITTTPSRFKLPNGWYVKNVLRSDGSRIDKYYLEQGTGQKFRSLKEVERYLTGVEYTPSRKALKLSNHIESPGSRKMIISGGMLLSLDKEETNQLQLAVVAPTIPLATSPFTLPEGWIVEEVPRKCNGHADKYYYEPGTRRKFRSLISVERYLAEEADNAPLSQVFKLDSRAKNFGSRKKIFREKVNTSTSDSVEPPAKINWVLADPGGSTWNAFSGDSMVPEPVKQRWANRFMLMMNNGR
ncbi:methyl-CpG-binding domain-containing protein 7-like isoform X2 [Actinidia eriantha]|uniref:methyl-CpG-binding domain-containing protein 7-like isoform X2 n=1 Tax=Actinidia eriantha TaxID=165200 RepID=UPI002584D643|nr:methyl-CpG-binding domain-containing protein 7-like isoform X2 [Actinidia eriantha]